MNPAHLTPLPWHAQNWQSLSALHARHVHAILLTGAAGRGKLWLSEAFAAWLLCENHGVSASTACGICAGCALLRAGNHPDLQQVLPDTLANQQASAAAEPDDAAERVEATADAGSAKGAKASREIRLEQIHQLARAVAMTTHRAGMRVVILGPAEALNGPSANALLKTLEEPAPRTLFLLFAHDLDEVLPTVRSRCVIEPVALPTVAQAVAWLRTQGADDANDAAARLAEAGGAPLHALAPETADALEPALRTRLLALLARGPALTSGEIAQAVPRALPVAAAIRLFQRWAADLLAHRSAGRVLYHSAEAAAIARLSMRLPALALFGWIDALRDARASAEHPLNARLVVEDALLAYHRAWAATANRN